MAHVHDHARVDRPLFDGARRPTRGVLRPDQSSWPDHGRPDRPNQSRPDQSRPDRPDLSRSGLGVELRGAPAEPFGVL